MKKSFLWLIAFTSFWAAGLNATTHITNFISSEGFTEDETIVNKHGWIGQAPWITKDVAGSGYATNSINFNRAVLWSNETFNVGDSYTLKAVLSLEDASKVNQKTDMFRFGLTEVFDAGAPGNKPKAGMIVRPAAIKYFIDEANNTSNNPNEVNTGVAIDTLTEHTYTTVITKSAIQDTFEITIDFDDGTANGTYSVVDAALYAADTLFPMIDSVQANDKGGIRLNSFTSIYIPETSTLSLLIGVFALVLVVLRNHKV
jgi:hypothetical protein